MKQHQVLTGSANSGNHCYSVGQVAQFTFWAYGSGCDLVICSSSQQPIQIISGNRNVLITAVACSESNGQIAVAYRQEIVIFKPYQSSIRSTVCYKWERGCSFSLENKDGIASNLSWNYYGDHLLIGCACISLWSCSSSIEHQPTRVSFQLDGNDAPELETNNMPLTWEHVWSSSIEEYPVQLSFSPTTSKHQVFASVAKGECMIKVWYSFILPIRHSNVLLQRTLHDKVDFTFTYLLHPQPVIGFEWRKNFLLKGVERFSNVLISSCRDQICRVWVETKQPVSRLMRFQTTQDLDQKPKKKDFDDKFKKAASTPMLSSSAESTFWTHPLRHSKQPKVCHYHIAASINPLSDIPLLPSIAIMNPSNKTHCDENSPVFTVHWLNNKYYQIQLLYNKLLEASSGAKQNFGSTLAEVDEHRKKSLHGIPDIISSNISSQSSFCDKDNELSIGKIEQLVNTWQGSRDALFAIHPSDGSLLIWHIDYLDEERSGLLRQPQVCFSSRIPMVFSSGDAATLCPKIVLFVNHSGEQNLLHSASLMSFKSTGDYEEETEETFAYSDVKLLSKHNDGSLNLWQISFSDITDFSSVTSITHTWRFCGHCFHMSGISSHPVLPLSVSTATHNGVHEPESRKLSELILWRLDPVGPLSYSGGLSELARVSCQKGHLFAEVAWFALLFPNWSLGIENKSPSTALIALTNNRLQIYQAVVDASQILAEAMSPMTTEFCMSNRNLISQQSSVHPGCVLHLLTEEDHGRHWGKVIFLETFSESLFSAPPEGVSNHFSKFWMTFYVVMLETSEDGCFVHTWKISYSANLANTVGKRFRKTTVHMLDSSEEESEEEISFEEPTTFSCIDVNVIKLSCQRLPVSNPIIDACSGSGKFNVFYTAGQQEHAHPAPYHVCTISSGGRIDFWHCTINKNDTNVECSWNLWKGAESPKDTVNGGETYHISISGKPVLVKAASNTLLACMSVDSSADDEIVLVVSIYECASSGGSCWKAQDTIKYSPAVKKVDQLVMSNLHLDWLSREEGSFFLAIGYDVNIHIYSLAPRDMGSFVMTALDKHESHSSPSSLDVHTRQKLFSTSKYKSSKRLDSSFNDPSTHKDLECEFHWRLLRWTKLTELNVKTSKTLSYDEDEGMENDSLVPCPVTVSWARDGILIVATETELHIFSQWISPERLKKNVLTRSYTASPFSSVPLTKGLSEIAEKVCPTLLQYHPLVLSELMHSGHLDAVRQILIHLSLCVNGDLNDSTCEQISICLEKYQFCEQLSSILEQCSRNKVTPYPLHELVGINGKVNSAFSTLKKSPSRKPTVRQSEPKEVEQSLDDILAEDEDNSPSNDDELDEILGYKPKNESKPLEHVDLSQFESNYFGQEHCSVIHEFLTRNQLPGLNSLEQLELMALADTLVNASTLKQVLSQEGGSADMGLNANERGYAVSGGGSTALDACGIRFIMAVHNHLCLLNSLPRPNRAALLKQGLSTCHFAWAFHSETEEEMLSQLPTVQRGSPEWPELRSFGVAWWIRSTVLLRRLVEKTARAAFLEKQDPLDAALYYLALNKKAVLCGLFRSVKDTRMNTFFQHNFTEERWRKAALKNAFVLMGKQRFYHATAFFLLGGSVHDAIKVCVDKLKDIQLAILIVRLREYSDISYHQLLSEFILGEGEQTDTIKWDSDSFEKSMAHWILGRYDLALSSLLEDIQHEDISDVFNFYMFLHSHPIVLRNKAHGKDLKSVEQVDKNGVLKYANEKERQLIFQTAVVHLESGCPLLALDCLSRLPKFITEKQATHHNSSQPNQATKEEIPPTEDHSNLASVVDVDWSQPISMSNEDELELDWSEEEDEEESDDASRPAIRFAVSSPDPPAPIKSEDVISVEEDSEKEVLNEDVFAQHLRMTACFQIFVQELKAIANAYNTDGGQLRLKLYIWLENASRVLHNVFGWDDHEQCSEGLNLLTNRADEDTFSESEESLVGSFGAKVGSSQGAPSLHELIFADNQDWKTRRSLLASRRKWLHCHHNFIRTLLSYCILHDSAYGKLATMRMELLLLLQESLQDKNVSRSLASPLPSPTDTIPLVTSSIASCKTVVADPLTYLCHMTRDILRAALSFVVPPHPNSSSEISQKCAMLCSQSAALSTCIYQSLCDTSSPNAHSQVLKVDSHSLDGTLEGNFSNTSPSTNIFHNSFATTSGVNNSVFVTATSPPSQWPGVALLQAMLNSETSTENRTKILVLLCESTVAVFVSLLIHAMQTHNTSLLYRLTSHLLESKMWNAVFGGGTKIPVKYVKSSSSLKQLGSHNVSKIRDRMNFKLLSGSADRKGSATPSSSQDALSYREKFVPPEVGLWDWFLSKPFKMPVEEGAAKEYDSDDEEDDSSEVSSLSEEYGNDSLCDKEMDSGQKMPETDPDSYSWKLMRYAIVKVAADNLQAFLPLAGFELNELSTHSPFLSAILRVLQEWQLQLNDVLDECDCLPPDYLPSMSYADTNQDTVSRPAVLRYQALLEPNNTPFIGRGKQYHGCQRLWHSLVKKETVQDTFIKYIFDKKPEPKLLISTEETDPVESLQMKEVSGLAPEPDKKSFNQPVKILHKDHELIAAFCVNNVNSNCLALASAKDIQEIDVSELLASDSWTWIDESASSSDKLSAAAREDDFLFVAAPARTSHGVFSPTSSIPWSSTSQTGQGANVLMKRPCGGIRRMEAHPTLPYYLTGSRDGSIFMWEWGHQQHISQFPLPSHSSKISNVHFSALGNKVSCVDGDGYLTMWQVSSNRHPYFRHHVHDRVANDFCFVSSSSVVATAGSSNNSKNVAIWDTLMPSKSMLVKDFSAYEQSGASCIKYLSRYRTILVGGKNGHVTTFDDRCLHAPLHRYAAHDVAIKCLAVDPNERFYVTGSSSGDIKIWDSLSHKLLSTSSYEHPRSSLFKNFGSGTVQVMVTDEHLLSCGADGSLKMKLLPDPDSFL